MGYYVKFLPDKKSAPSWKVQFVSYKKEDTKDSKAKKPKHAWDVSKPRWPALGFHNAMTLEEARVRAKQLNAQLILKRQEEQIRKIEQIQAQTQRRYDAVLPSEFVTEFEARFIRKRDSQTDQGLRKNTRSYTVWRAAQRLIAAIGVDPSEWFYHTHAIYDYFCSLKMSPKYASLVLKTANLWGFFVSRKLAKPFLQVSPPRGFERQRLIEANYEKERGVSRASKTLAPGDLDRLMRKINQKNFNWLYISVWFGLRPKEIDLLKNPETWNVETLPNGRKILWVFQTKIISLPPEDRWKPIPLIFDEQHFAFKMIEDGNFKRPLMKTMRKHFGDGVLLYAGRKGFSDLMLARDQSFENISIWMGHSSLQRTWRSYKNRKRFHLVGY